MTCRRLSSVSWVSGDSAIRPAPMAPWMAPASMSAWVRRTRRSGRGQHGAGDQEEQQAGDEFADPPQ